MTEDSPKTPLASAYLTLRSSLRQAYRRSWGLFCWGFGHDYWISLDSPVSGPLLYTCQRCTDTLLVYREEGDLTVRFEPPDELGSNWTDITK